MSTFRTAVPVRHQPRKIFTAERNRVDMPGELVAEAAAIPIPGVPAPRVDMSEVLAAIARLEGKLTRSVEIAPEVDKLQVEISEIAGRIKATKVEMAALRHPLMEENRFRRAADDLSAIVGATERATTQIIECAERIDEIANELQSTTPDAYISSQLAQISDVVMQVYEACNFQDLTGQKIRKVVATLSFIEERIDNMVAMWNESELAALPMPPSLERMDGEVSLHGPDLSGDEVSGNASQADIDALFD
jgi:chemotaxis protein CheZ